MNKDRTTIFGIHFKGKISSKDNLQKIKNFLPQFINWLNNSIIEDNKANLNINEIKKNISKLVLKYQYEEILIEWIKFYEKNNLCKFSKSSRDKIINLFKISCPKFNLDIDIYLEKCFLCKKEFYKREKTNQKYCSNDCANSTWRANEVGENFVIFSRDKHRCIYCGLSSINNEIKLVLDHVIPYSIGGLSIANNLITSCEPCNSSKYDKIISPDILKEIQNEIYKRNIENNISGLKIIKGSHQRSLYENKIKESKQLSLQLNTTALIENNTLIASSNLMPTEAKLGPLNEVSEECPSITARQMRFQRLRTIDRYRRNRQSDWSDHIDKMIEWNKKLHKEELYFVQYAHGGYWYMQWRRRDVYTDYNKPVKIHNYHKTTTVRYVE